MTAGRLAPGLRVRVRCKRPAGHVRTPAYTQGRTGVIERDCGDFPNPEERAYGRSGMPALPLYRVRFPMRELWPGASHPEDSVDVEVYGHWLVAAD